MKPPFIEADNRPVPGTATWLPVRPHCDLQLPPYKPFLRNTFRDSLNFGPFQKGCLLHRQPKTRPVLRSDVSGDSSLFGARKLVVGNVRGDIGRQPPNSVRDILRPAFSTLILVEKCNWGCDIKSPDLEGLK